MNNNFGELNQIDTERQLSIEEHNKLRQSAQYKEQETRSKRLTHDAIQALQICWLMSTRSQELSDNWLTFRFIDELIYSLIAISIQINEGLHNPARREMRYLLESAVKHYYVDNALSLPNAKFDERMKILGNPHLVPRSSVSFAPELKIFAFEEDTGNEFSNEITGLYSDLCKYVHRSKEQIDIYLNLIEKGVHPGFESIDEYRKINQEYARVCDIILTMNFASLGVG